jgi:hypothetical protein
VRRVGLRQASKGTAHGILLGVGETDGWVESTGKRREVSEGAVGAPWHTAPCRDPMIDVRGAGDRESRARVGDAA